MPITSFRRINEREPDGVENEHECRGDDYKQKKYHAILIFKASYRHVLLFLSLTRLLYTMVYSKLSSASPCSAQNLLQTDILLHTDDLLGCHRRKSNVVLQKNAEFTDGIIIQIENI